MTIQLNDRELATVLAALRYWQQALGVNEHETPTSPDRFDDQNTLLTVVEIDAFCERLNAGGLAEGATVMQDSLVSPTSTPGQEPYQDKFWVVEQLRKQMSPELLPYFAWLLEVWNTNRDYAHPSLEEYDPLEDDDEENFQAGRVGS